MGIDESAARVIEQRRRQRHRAQLLAQFLAQVRQCISKTQLTCEQKFLHGLCVFALVREDEGDAWNLMLRRRKHRLLAAAGGHQVAHRLTTKGLSCAKPARVFGFSCSAVNGISPRSDSVGPSPKRMTASEAIQVKVPAKSPISSGPRRVRCRQPCQIATMMAANTPGHGVKPPSRMSKMFQGASR